MSTVVPFTPSTTSVFGFQPVIAGTQYSATVTWNLYAQRYYLNLYDTGGNLILCTAIVGSGPKLQATLTWESTGFTGVATVETATPHNIPVGQLANVYISQTDTGFDGAQQVLATGPTTVIYALANPNVNEPVAGQMSFPVNLVQALGAGWLIYNYADQTFEYETTS